MQRRLMLKAGAGMLGAPHAFAIPENTLDATCVEWPVEHTIALPSSAINGVVTPIQIPIIDHAAFIVAAKKGEKRFDISRMVSSTSKRDGWFFENKLTHTIHYQAVGRLLSRTNQGLVQGSAFAVGPRLVVTAGHCVHTGRGGAPMRDVLFQPGFPALNRTVRVERVIASSHWVDRSDYTHDVALLKTSEVISDAMWFGIKTDIPYKENKGWGVYGYPGKAPFDGTKPFGDTGPITRKPWSNGELQFSLLACDNIDLTQGASGGPWVGSKPKVGIVVIEGKLPDPKHTPLYVTGLNSFFYDRYPGIMISPQFNVHIREFLVKSIAMLNS